MNSLIKTNGGLQLVRSTSQRMRAFQLARPVVQRQIVVVQQSLRLPSHMTRLRVICNGDGGRQHPLPVLAQFKGPALSQNGTLVAKYACPLCAHRYFMAQNPQGKVFQMWMER